jgi:DHA2 family multidrug resistance protein
LSAKASARDWMAVLAVNLGATIAFMDIAITTASLGDIQASLNTTFEETTWITTAYLIAEVVVIPITGWLASIFSPRNYIIANTILFTIFTVACGAAHTLPQMVFARICQGLTGGVLIPMASHVIVSRLPLSQRPLGLMIYASSISVGPAIGAALGGWLTYQYHWSYSFYFQVIPAAGIVYLLYKTLDPKPMQLHLLKDGDWLGMILMALGLGSITYIFEEGNRLDWFNDSSIKLAAVTACVAFPWFLICELTRKKPFINLRLFSRPYFLFSNIVTVFNSLSAWGHVFLVPRICIQVLGYSALQTGKIIAWIGIPQMALMPLFPYIFKKTGPKTAVIVGLLFSVASAVSNAGLTHDFGPAQLIVGQCLRAIGQSIVFSQLAGIAFLGMEKEIGSASALYNTMRQASASLSIGAIGLLLEARYHLHFSRISETVTRANPVVNRYLTGAAQTFVKRGPSGESQAIASLFSKINREAYIMAYADCSWMVAIYASIAVLFVFMLRPPKRS